MVLFSLTQTAEAAKLVSAKCWYTAASTPNFEFVLVEEKGDLGGKECKIEERVGDDYYNNHPVSRRKFSDDAYYRARGWTPTPFYRGVENEMLDTNFKLVNGHISKDNPNFTDNYPHTYQAGCVTVQRKGSNYIITVNGTDNVVARFNRGFDYKESLRPLKWHYYLTIKPRRQNTQKKVLDEDFSFIEEKEIVFQDDLTPAS